jgi:hypothetical protein
MQQSNNLKIGSVYNFTMYSPAIVGASYNSATVLGILDFDSARLIQDVAPLHAAAYPGLPSGTPIQAKDLIYIKIKTSSGEIRVIAQDWVSTTPILVTSQTVLVTINNLDLTKLPILRAMLASNGFTNFSISTT